MSFLVIQYTATKMQCMKAYIYISWCLICYFIKIICIYIYLHFYTHSVCVCVCLDLSDSWGRQFSVTMIIVCSIFFWNYKYRRNIIALSWPQTVGSIFFLDSIFFVSTFELPRKITFHPFWVVQRCLPEPLLNLTFHNSSIHIIIIIIIIIIIKTLAICCTYGMTSYPDLYRDIFQKPWHVKSIPLSYFIHPWN